MHPHNSCSPSCLYVAFKILEGHNEVSPEPSLLQAKQAQFAQPFFLGEVFQSSDHLSGTPLDPLQELRVFFVLRAPGLDTVFQMGPHKSQVERDNHLPVPAGHPSSDGAQGTVCFPRCKSTLLAHVKFFIHRDPQILLCRAMLKDCSQWLILSCIQQF